MNAVLRTLGRWLPRLLADRRGSSDLNTYLLLTAAGCAMVGLTAPHLFNSSKTASDTFEKQVQVLQQGASPGAGGASGAGSSGGWNIGDLGGLSSFANQLGLGNSGTTVSTGASTTTGQGTTVSTGAGTISGTGTTAQQAQQTSAALAAAAQAK